MNHKGTAPAKDKEKCFFVLSGSLLLRGRQPVLRVSQKPRKEGNHKDTETQSFFGLAQATPGRQKSFLCALVSLWSKAFMLFAITCFAGMTAGWNFVSFCLP